MATKNRTINVTVEESTASLLSHVAQQEQKSIERLVRELTLEALQIGEDFYLSTLAEKLDRERAETYRHDDVWKETTLESIEKKC
ncbi:hypothetical protein H0W26_01960 [Candidatus Dependentiae bacterium]|nr:hypothetical protein [Candidatus Dependentiae bacterium]